MSENRNLSPEEMGLKLTSDPKEKPQQTFPEKATFQPPTLETLEQKAVTIDKRYQNSEEYERKKAEWTNHIGVVWAEVAAGRVSKEKAADILAKLAAERDMEAEVDELTEVYNRRAFMNRASEVIAHSHREGESTTMAIFDVDHFKKINDTYGHAIGDLVLHHLGAYLRREVRQEDVAGRYGGEEFALILPSTDDLGARLMLERMHKQLPETIKEAVKNSVEANPDLVAILREQGLSIDEITITISGGFAQVVLPEDTYQPINPSEIRDTALRSADGHLYRAKKDGRNRIYPPPPPPDQEDTSNPTSLETN